MIVTRYMTEDKQARIVAHLFAPALAPGEELDADTLGRPTLSIRESPGDIWGEPREISAADVTYADWVALLEQYGFRWEERS